MKSAGAITIFLLLAGPLYAAQENGMSPPCKQLGSQPKGSPDFSGTFDMQAVYPVCRMAPCPARITFRAAGNTLGKVCAVTIRPRDPSVDENVPASRSVKRTMTGDLWIRDNAAFVLITTSPEGDLKP